ncbi:MAG: MFS transporter [Clostridia bacterium]|nr:MFS transporter [Clostridia bacterium]
MENLDVKKNWKRTFAIIYTGQIFSLLSSSIVQFAIIWYLTFKTGSAIVLATATIAAILPQIILGPFLGVIVDRLDRKKIMIIADLLIALSSIILAIFFYIGEPSFYIIYLILALRSIGSAFHTPAMQASVPLLAPEDKIVKVSGISQTMLSISYILSPILAGSLYGNISTYIIILLDVIGAAIAVVSLLLVTIPKVNRVESEKKHFFHEMLDGVKELSRDKLLLILTIHITILIIIYMPVNSLFPLMTSNYFKLQPMHASIIEVAFALGMFLGGLLMTLWGGFKKKQYTILLFASLFGIALALSGLVQQNGYILFLAYCFIMGITVPYFNGIYIAIIQTTIKPEMLGRVFAFINSLMLIGTPIGLILSAPFAEKIGVQNWFLLSGIGIVIISVIVSCLKKVRESE